MTAGALLRAAAAACWAASGVSHCPEGSRPVRTVDSKRPWACALTSERYQDGMDCPAGTLAVTTPDTNSPFKCAVEGVTLQIPRGICPPGNQAVPTTDPDKEYGCEPMGQGFHSGPRCPKGSRPVPTPGAMQSFKCVTTPPPADPLPTATPAFDVPPKKTRAEAAREAGPLKGGTCPKGTRRVVTENPFEPVQCLPDDGAAPKAFKYRAFRLPGALAFEYPKDWDLTDAWKDEEPAIYIRPGHSRDGRPVSLSVIRHRRSAAGYVDLETRIWQDEDWHSFKEIARTRDGGRLTVHLESPEGARLSLVGADDGYFELAYGAPEDLYKGFLPAFERLAVTFRNLETK